MDGIINIYKEAGYTSFDVVAKLRGILHIKKIGHTGTLDPEATGVLPVCIGKATKVVDIITDRDKTYEAEVVLGVETDTLDTTGKVLRTSKVDVSKDELSIVLSSFTGEITQIPPMYSAVKVDGKRLYEYARDGKEVARKERSVTIYGIDLMTEDMSFTNTDIFSDLDVSDIDDNYINKLPSFRIRVKCSKGTYIRTLCDDIGRKLGCGAAMKSLVRTAVGRFDISGATTLAEVEKILSDESDGGLDKTEVLYREGRLISVDEVFDDYSKLYIKPSAEKKLINGNPLEVNDFTESLEADEGSAVRVYGADGSFFAIYRFAGGRFKVAKFFR